MALMFVCGCVAALITPDADVHAVTGGLIYLMFFTPGIIWFALVEGLKFGSAQQ
jgi:hypothetical protein